MDQKEQLAEDTKLKESTVASDEQSIVVVDSQPIAPLLAPASKVPSVPTIVTSPRPEWHHALMLGNILMAACGVLLLLGVLLIVAWSPLQMHDILAGINLWIAILGLTWLGALGLFQSSFMLHAAFSSPQTLLKLVFGLIPYSILIGNIVLCFGQKKETSAKTIKRAVVLLFSTLILLPFPVISRLQRISSLQFGKTPGLRFDYLGCFIGSVVSFLFALLASHIHRSSVELATFSAFLFLSMTVIIPVTLFIRRPAKRPEKPPGADEFAKTTIQRLYAEMDPKALRDNWFPSRRFQFSKAWEQKFRDSLSKRRSTSGSLLSMELSARTLGQCRPHYIPPWLSSLCARYDAESELDFLADYTAGIEFETGSVGIDFRLIYSARSKRWYFISWRGSNEPPKGLPGRFWEISLGYTLIATKASELIERSGVKS